jgi:hypothetical protein
MNAVLHVDIVRKRYADMHSQILKDPLFFYISSIVIYWEAVLKEPEEADLVAKANRLVLIGCLKNR